MFPMFPSSDERTRSALAFLATDQIAEEIGIILRKGVDPVMVAMLAASRVSNDARAHEMFGHALVRYAQEKLKTP